MATDPYWQLSKDYTTITATHDLTIKAIEYEDITRIENDALITTRAPTKVHEFRVQRAILVAASPVLANLLATNGAEKTTVELHGDSAKALEIWFKILHSSPSSPELEDTEFTHLATSIKDVLDVLATAHKYGLDVKAEKAQIWFAAWFDAQVGREDGKKFGYLDFQALVYPCWAFDYAGGFTFVTKALVYRSNGQIFERQPEGFRDESLHVPGGVVREFLFPLPLPLHTRISN